MKRLPLLIAMLGLLGCNRETAPDQAHDSTHLTKLNFIGGEPPKKIELELNVSKGMLQDLIELGRYMDELKQREPSGGEALASAPPDYYGALLGLFGGSDAVLADGMLLFVNPNYEILGIEGHEAAKSRAEEWLRLRLVPEFPQQ